MEMFFSRSRGERHHEASGPYWKQRGWQMSAAFLGVVVALSGIVALTSGRDTADGRGSGGDTRTVAGPSESPLPGAGRPEGCRTDDSAGDTLPTAVPDDVEWRALNLAQVPVSASAGPTRTEGPLWWCFAHTPAGAALAAHVIPAQMTGPDWRTVIERQLVAGRGRDMFEFQRSLIGDSAADAYESSEYASYSGFSVLSYSKEKAAVELVMKNGQSYGRSTITLLWNGGDWKIVPRGNGSLHTPVEQVQSLEGRLLWGRPS